MGTPNKVTAKVKAELLRLWHEGRSQRFIAQQLRLNPMTVSNHLRALLGVDTPEWKGTGRAVLQRGAKEKAPPPSIAYPDNPPRLAFAFELEPGEAARFWSKVAAPNENGCRLWLASCKPDGGGQFGTLTSSSESAYRVSWRLTYGPIPEDKQLNHRCDVRPCVEPTHLWAGTQAQNLADMAAKGRSRRGRGDGQKGEDNVTAVLTWEKVRALRAARAKHGFTFDELAERFKISASQVSNIVNNRQWIE